MNSRRLRWRFHFNASHNMTPEREEGKHAHSFLVILCMEVGIMNLAKQNECENALKEYFNCFNGKYLNEFGVFADKLPTIENIGEAVFEEIEKISADYGLKLIQLEVGDSPVAMYCIGNKLLLGGMYREISQEAFETYREFFEWNYGKA